MLGKRTLPVTMISGKKKRIAIAVYKGKWKNKRGDVFKNLYGLWWPIYESNRCTGYEFRRDNV